MHMLPSGLLETFSLLAKHTIRAVKEWSVDLVFTFWTLCTQRF